MQTEPQEDVEMLKGVVWVAVLALAGLMCPPAAETQSGGGTMVTPQAHVEYIPAGLPGGPTYYCQSPGFACVVSWSNNGDVVGYNVDPGGAVSDFLTEFAAEVFCTLLPPLLRIILCGIV